MTRNASTFRSRTRMQYTIGFKREFAITINVDTSSIKSDVLPNPAIVTKTKIQKNGKIVDKNKQNIRNMLFRDLR